MPREIEARRIFTSPLDRLPGRARHYRKLLPLFPWAIRQFDFGAYDLVLSTSHAVAKSVCIPSGVAHLDYCFTPMRYIWDQSESYLGRGIRRRLASPLVHALRRFDVQTSGEDTVSRFVAVSTDVADRIERHYGRKAKVVPPPVDTAWIETASRPPEDSFLLVGGFVPYKREDVAIEAFRQSGHKLIVVGDGPMRTRLERRAPSNIEFTGRVDDATLALLYRSCRALIYPQHEDFGLVAVEAQAAGRPVIGFGRGGLLDTVRPFNDDDLESARYEATGIFFDEQTPASLRAAIAAFEKIEHRFLPPAIRRWADSFSPDRFDRAFDPEIVAALETARRRHAEKVR